MAMAMLISDGTTTLYEYFGSASGALHLHTSLVAANSIFEIAAPDVNHDGKIDLLLSDAHFNLDVWFGKGSGSFNVGPATPMVVADELSVGDFDGDGHADVLAQFTASFSATAQVFYGDGAGHFTASPRITEDSGFDTFAAYDVNGDGRMDLIFDPFPFQSTHAYSNIIKVYYGNANRTLTTHQVTLANCTISATPPAVADFNGDGINDIMVVEGSDCQGNGPDTVNVLLGNSDGTYQAEQVVYTGPTTDFLGEPDVLRLTETASPMWSYGTFLRLQTESSQYCCGTPQQVVFHLAKRPTTTPESLFAHRLKQ
jgi:hypothetical protein